MAANVKELAALFLVVFGLAILGTGGIRRLAWQKGWLATPKKDRWHTKPVALHGGVGFFLAFFLGATYIIARNILGDGQFLEGRWLSPEIGLAVALSAGGLLMFSLGLADDIRNFRPVTKLIGQLVAASLFIIAGGVFSLTGFLTINIILTYLWFVGITNAVNMLDNMDGLAAGVTMISTATLLILMANAQGISLAEMPVFPLGLVFIAALLGFWLYNRPPASIFMGDSGSLFMGYTLAGLTIPTFLNRSLTFADGSVFLGSLFALVIPVTVLTVPIFDTTLVTLCRLWRGQSPAQGGCDHSSHRLAYLGLPEKHVVFLCYGVGAIGGLVAILLQQAPEPSLPLFAFFFLFLLLGGIYLAKVKIRYASKRLAPSKWTLLVNNLSDKQLAASVVFDVIVIVICFYTAYLIRFGGMLSQDLYKIILQSIPIVVTATLLINYLTGIYRNQWQLFSLSDLPTFFKGAIGASLLSISLVTIFTRFSIGHSRSAYIIYGLLLFFTQVGYRLSFHFFNLILLRNKKVYPISGRKPILIYGAGKTGKLLFENLLTNLETSNFYVEGFIDDDPSLAKKFLCGAPIMPPLAWSAKVWHQFPEIWVSSSSIPDERIYQFFSQWQGKPPVVKRLRVQMVPLSMATKEAPPKFPGGLKPKNKTADASFPAQALIEQDQNRSSLWKNKSMASHRQNIASQLFMDCWPTRKE